MKLNKIKTVLSDKGISQTWLAKQLDKSFSMVNAYACNRIQPNLETLQRIAEILQVSTQTVNYRIQQALKQLRVSLKDYLPLILLLFPKNLLS